LNILVPQIGLQCPPIMAPVRQGKPAGVPRHVRLDPECEPCLGASPRHHLREKPAVVNRAPLSDTNPTVGSLAERHERRRAHINALAEK
jgi:hypothetical protein